MKKIYSLLAFSAICFTACKKSESTDPSKFMSVTIDDSTWKLTNVSSRKDDILHTASYFATDESAQRTVDITLFDFSVGKRQYDIDTRTNNLTGNTAFYSYGGKLSYASVGTVYITGYSAGIVKGTFTFVGGNADITGTFAMPMPQ